MIEKNLSISAGQSSPFCLYFKFIMKQKSCLKSCAEVSDRRKQSDTEYSDGTICGLFAFISGFLVDFLRKISVCRRPSLLFCHKTPTHLESPHIQHILCQWCWSKHLLYASSTARKMLLSIRQWYAVIVLLTHLLDPSLWWCIWRWMVFSEKF